MNNASTRLILLIAVVAAVLGGVATYGVSALTGTGKTEVRISAQRLDDGRVEFALQPRDEDSSWGDRILPARRFFPAQGFVNSWANSTAIELDSSLPFYVNTTRPTRSLTLQQYLDRCSDGESEDPFDRDGDGERDEITWGEYLALVDELLTEAKSIAPPPELAEYYSEQIGAITAYAQYAFLQPPNDPIDLWGFLAIGIVARQLAQEAEASLTPEIRRQLVEAGCIEADESETSE